MNDDYDLLSTPALEFLKNFCLVIRHAGKQTKESREELRLIKIELRIRQAEEEDSTEL